METKTNVLDLIRKDGRTNIKINGMNIKQVSKYTLTQDMDKEEGRTYLEIKMAIDEGKSTITIEDENVKIIKE